MKKGFTLIELLGVIILLGLIGLIVIPSITKLLKDSRQNLYENQIKMIEDNARKWGLQNDDQLSEIEATYVSLTALIDAGYIEQDAVKDPRKNENMNGCVVVEYDSKTSKFKYKYNDSECSSLTFTNITAADPEYICYNFDASTGTVISYNTQSSNCSREIVMPDKIDGVSIEHIGPGAFINPNFQECEWYDEGDDAWYYDEIDIDYVHYEGDGYDNCWIGRDWDNAPIITSIVLPQLLKTIGYQAFEEIGLESLTIGKKVTEIGKSAFSYNELSTLNLSSTLTKIEDYAFENNYLTSVTIPDSVIYLSGFGANQLTSITIPDSVTTIGDSAFYDNEITSIIIPNGVTKIDDFAFENNYLTSVEIPDSVTYLSGFDGNQLDSIIIPDNVTTIGTGAFAYNELTSITIPDSVTTIKYGAFGYNQLTSVEIPDSVITIDDGVFGYNLLESITIPDTVVNLGYGVINNNLFPDEIAFMTKIVEDEVILLSYGGFKKSDVVIPDYITIIGDFAFSQTNITSVTIPDSIITIGYNSFAVNQLNSIEIPNSVTRIDSYAFSNNKILQGNAIIYNNSVNVNIEYGAFESNGQYSNTTITPVFSQ